MVLTIESKKKLAIIFFLIAGVTSTFAYKLQGSQIVS